MPAYNPPPQVFSSPVSNYYQGKALRADTALREKQAAALQMEIDSAPAAAEAAARKEQRDIEKHDRLQDKADREARQFWSDETKEIMSQVAEVGGAFTLARRDGVDLSVASQKYKSDLIDIVGEEAANAYWSSKIDLNDDGTVGPEEEKLIEASSIAVGKLQEEDKNKDYTLGSYRFSGETNEIIANAPKDTSAPGYAPTPLQKELQPLVDRGVLSQEQMDQMVLDANTTSSKLSDRDKRLRDVKALGASDEEAIDLVDKYISVTSSTDSGGNVTVTNTRTKESYKISARQALAAGLSIPSANEEVVEKEGYAGPQWAQPIALIEPGPNVQEALITEAQRSIQEIDKGLVAGGLISGQDVMDAAGVRNIAQRGVNNMLQLTFLNTLPRFFQTETDARLKVLNFNQAVRSAVVISSKGAIWEQQKVEQMLPNPDALLEDPVGAGIAYTRTMHWLMNQREAEVALLEGRVPTQIPRVPLGVEDDPIIITSIEEAEALPPGTHFLLDGRGGVVTE